VLGLKVTAGSNTLRAQVNPAGLATSYRAEYDRAGSAWCSRDGSKGTAANSTPLQTLGVADDVLHPVSIELGGLSPGGEYCAALVAINAFGAGAQVVFFTAAPAPVPIVSKVSPRSGTTAGGTLVRISGGNLATASAVQFGAAPAAIKTVTASEITVESPAHATGQVDVTVTTIAGTRASDLDAYTYIAPASFTLVVALAGSGSGTVAGSGISCPGTCSGTYPIGARVSLGASAASGAAFAGWSGGGCSGTSECQVTLTADAQITAIFNTSVSASGGGGTGGVKGSTESAPPPPALGQRQTAGPVAGTVSLRLQGQSAFTPLAAARSIPDGSEIDATNGRVLITVATPDGRTVSAELYGGRFRVHQDPSGETHFILTLALSGCAPVALPKGSAASAARARRRSGPRSRHLWASESHGKWGTNGRFVSTSVEGTTWLTLDECTRSRVKVTAGRVKVRDLVHKKTVRVRAGKQFVARSSTRGK
jgi:hypothetical protein